jgi:hypothetical protein
MNPHEELTRLLEERGEIERQIDVLQHRHAAVAQRIDYAKRHLSRMTLPCWTCAGGEEARYWMSSNSDLNAPMSPSGLPMNCCRVRTSTTVPILQVSGARL